MAKEKKEVDWNSLYDTSKHNFIIKCNNGKKFLFFDSVFIESMPEIVFTPQKIVPSNIEVIYESHLPSEHSYSFIINKSTGEYLKFWGRLEFNKILNYFVVVPDICTDCNGIPLQIWTIVNNQFLMIYSEKNESENNGISGYFWINQNELVFKKTNYNICKKVNLISNK